MDTVRTTIEWELRSWPGVTARPRRFGGTELRYGRKELSTCTATAWPTCPSQPGSGASW